MVGISRRQVGRIFDDAGIERGDPEVLRTAAPRRGVPDIDDGSHRRELFYFGQALRDRLKVLEPTRIVPLSPYNDGELLMWTGESASAALSMESPRDAEEEAMESLWGRGRYYDATTHPLYGCFRAHLDGNGCWRAIDDLIKCVPDYQRVCQEAWLLTETRVNSEIPDLRAGSGLIRSTFSIAYTTANKILDGKPDQPVTIGPMGFGGQTPRWEKLVSVAKDLAEAQHYRSLVVLWGTVQDLSASFKQNLQPNDLIRKLVSEGHCTLCP